MHTGAQTAAQAPCSRRLQDRCGGPPGPAPAALLPLLRAAQPVSQPRGAQRWASASVDPCLLPRSSRCPPSQPCSTQRQRLRRLKRHPAPHLSVVVLCVMVSAPLLIAQQLVRILRPAGEVQLMASARQLSITPAPPARPAALARPPVSRRTSCAPPGTGSARGITRRQSVQVMHVQKPRHRQCYHCAAGGPAARPIVHHKRARHLCFPRAQACCPSRAPCRDGIAARACGRPSLCPWP